MAILTTHYAIFNAYNFNSVAGLSVVSIVTPGNQKKTLSIAAMNRSNSRKVSSGFFQSNQLNIRVVIQQLTLETRDAALQTLLQNIQSLEGTLIVPITGLARQYTASYEDFTINQSSGGFIDLTLHFQCSDSYGYDTTATTIYNLTNQTASTNNYPYVQGGTADTQAPVITVQLNTTPGTPAGSITIGNTVTGQAVVVSKTFANHDIIIVDAKNNSVTYNGVDTYFSGGIPTFGLGAQTIYVTDSLGTRNYRFTAQVQNRFF